ncbi:uncharacterized protein C19orf44 homolog isoform X2 [Nelusetta ayraudi]|uniref:uncharacterized protein C19orf44 homolog isoform X2 n=1 Tax=Nelusetta ayraudi TaxID=303726 RepID=UPI003F6FF335
MWRRGGRSAALDRAQALLSSRGNGRGDGESAQCFLQEETWQQTNARSAPSNTHTLPSDVSDLSSVSSASDHGAVGKIQERPAGSPKHLRPQSSLAGGLGDGGGGTGGSRFLKKKALPTDALSSRSSQFVSKGQLKQEQPPPPHLRGSQTAALSRLADLESRIRGRKPAGQVLKPASDLMLSPAPSSPAPAAAAQPLGPSAAAAAAQPLGLSPPSSDEQSLKGKRFLKSNRAPGVKAGQPAGPGVGMGPRPGAADGAQPSASTEMRWLTGVSLESDEEDMKKLLGDSLDSVNSYFTHARPKSSKTAHEMKSRHSRSVSTTPHPPAAIPPSPPSSPSVPTPRSPASPFRFTGHTQAQFSSSTFSPPPSSPHASPSPAGSPQRPLSSMSSNSVILSLAELFPVGSQEPRSDTSLASADDFKINALTLDDLVPVKLTSTEETPDKEGEQKSASHSRAIQQHHQQQLRHDNNQHEAPDYESDFESESRRTDVKEVQLSECRLGQSDDEEEEAEPVSEVMEEVSNVSRGSEDVVYSDTFSEVSSSYTSRSSDHSGGRSSRASRSCDGRLERRDSARKVFKDAVVQTQLAPPTYSWTAGLSPAGGEAFPDPTPVITHLSAKTVEAIGSFNPSAFVLTELLKQQLAATKRFIESNRQLHDSLLRSLEPPNYRYTTLEDTRELIRKHRRTVRGLDE